MALVVKASIMKIFFITAVLLNIVCGNPSRILNGQLAAENEFPGMLSLQYNDIHVCGAAVVNTEWALTAAHCFHTTSGFSVVSGSIYLSGGNRHNVIDIVFHPEFDPFGSLENDIALVMVSGSFSTDPSVLPMLVAGPSFTLQDSTSVTAIGWGAEQEGSVQLSPVLRKANLVIWNHQQCYDTYLSTGFSVHTSQICAADPDFLQGSCDGDSGGPLVIPDPTVGGPVLLVGIEAWRLGCAREGYPTVYTYVGAYHDWIFSVVGI